MAECDECGEYENLPYQCHRCGQSFCADHRLPENHSCPGLSEWDDPEGVFDSGFDDSVDNPGGSRGPVERVRSSVESGVSGATSTGGVLGYFRGNATYTFLGIMWVTFLFQFVVFPELLGIAIPTQFRASPTWSAVFVLSSAHPEYLWTWVTSVFSHGGFTHILFNSIALYFFGPVVERRLGTKRFTALFLLSGAVAGLAQISTTVFVGGPTARVVGASGAIMAIMGLLTVLQPKLPVRLYGIIPVPLWLLTFGFAGFSVVAGFSSIGFASGVAHLAHLAGMVIGLAYGARVKGEQRMPDQLRLGDRGPGGPGRGRL